MSRRDHWRERQRNPWPHTSREAKKQQKKSHFWYLIRIDPVEHIKNFGRGQIHIFQTRTNLQVYKQNTVSQRWETQARGSPWIKLDWETPTWTWSKETRARTFIIYLHLTERRGSKLIRQKKKLSLTTSDKSQAPPGVDLRDLKARLTPSFVTPVSTHRVASVGFSVRTWSNANTEANKQNIQSPCLKTKAAPRNKRGA